MNGRGRTIAVWAVSVLLAALFLAAGFPKVLGAEEVVQNFQRWGYPASFRVFIGICEIAGGIGLLVPRVAALAAAGLFVIMLGAVYTHLSNAAPGVAVPIVAALLLAVVGRTRFATSSAGVPAGSPTGAATSS